MTTYTMNLHTMKYIDLFDELPYKDVKYFIHNDDFDEYEVEIEHLYCERIAWCKTKFTFTINIYEIDRTFKRVIYYNTSSPIALALMDIEYNEESEEDGDNEESDEEDDIDNEEEEGDGDNGASEDNEESDEDGDNGASEDNEDDILSRAQ